MNCTTVPSYSKCQPAVSAHQILGIQSCNPGLLEKELVTADHTLGGGGCVKGAGERLHFPDGDFGAYAYACPIKKGDQGMLGLCNTMRGNGVVLSCDVLVPAVTDQILKRGGCNGGTPSGVYACPSGMMALCNQFVNVGGVILACQALPPRGAENGSATMKNPRLVAYRAGLDPLRVLPAITRSHDVGWS